MRSKFIVVCLLPLLWLCVDIAFDNLGSNPVQALHIRLGDWSLRFLCLTLAITPIQTITKWRGMADYRQLFGLYAFFYASLHLLGYLLADHALMWRIIGIDIIESPYIWFGVLAYGIIFLLALTSPKWAKKRMGKTWKKLHRLIYIAAVAAIIHYFWQLKGNLAEPLFYSIIVFLLLGFRVLVWVKNRQLTKMMIPTGQRVLALAEKQGVIQEAPRKQR
ncbi:MAG: sulfoxide reductase heme-binding subunit YedZ [Methylobacter tundripaludum]|uniref:sulfite oxidase heme-binding subunit YedZ n=1 Tax=Methylobacter tundripaludum TaxID=173365 RepID=UPI0021575A49|nr:protein-methionine-sulfoxide reductase heme-binding subunit MsrQ [Methylobacter tundripaludum]MCK9635715.1 sulfoxide reductase heme-binding subunit YedZ [Methylobacter tundripaludum]